MQQINLDANASYGLIPEVREVITSGYCSFLNPSSIHSGGQKAKAILEEAREKVKNWIGAGPDYRVIFTSGATEANNHALWGACLAQNKPETSHIVISGVEHPCVIETVKKLGMIGVSSTQVLPGKDRSFKFENFLEAISPSTVIVSLMAANNETGRIYPVREIATKIKKHRDNIIFHSDAVQLFGKVNTSINDLNADMISLSAHKIGGLSGIGALVVNKTIDLPSFISGGPQEVRFRAGTENIIGALSFGIAAEVAHKNLENRIKKMREIKTNIYTTLKSEFSEIELNTPESESDSIPNTVNIRFPGLSASDLVVALDISGVYISAGSACASGKADASHVFLAEGYTHDYAKESVRISVTDTLSDAEIKYALEVFVASVKRMKSCRKAA